MDGKLTSDITSFIYEYLWKIGLTSLGTIVFIISKL